MKKLKMPAFRSEAAEARWWYAHREVLDRDFEEAAKAGTLKKLTRLAARNGLPYQTYMKSLLHQALEREEKRRAS
jgi:hypothetical protein